MKGLRIREAYADAITFCAMTSSRCLKEIFS